MISLNERKSFIHELLNISEEDMTHLDKDIYLVWNRYRKTSAIELKNKLILHYIWLVKYVVQTMNLPNNSILNDEDFMSIGILGLHEAIERFELERGVKFESYAIPRIRGIIQDELRRLDWLSRTARKKAHEFIQASDELRKQTGREVSAEEIRQKLNVTPEEYNTYLSAAAAAKASYTLNEASSQNISDDDERDIIQEVPDNQNVSILEKMESEERINFITNFIRTLNERKKLVMTLYYYENLTFKEIGNMINVSESRVCQIHSQVVQELKEKLLNFDRS
jgi:RNA polymerase sigma factor for flagellar operon FliA